MPEYRIVAKIDPGGVVTGRAKVEQELRNLDNSVNRTTGNMDRMTASEFKAAGGLDGLNKASAAAAQGQRGLENATERVLKAVDAEAAELVKLNKLLADAKRLHDAGAISTDQFAKVQALADKGVRAHTASLGQQRAGYTQLGFQIQDITQTIALGINPLTVLAQQGGQTASALSLALGEGGAAGRAATFMAGPWGSLILAATTILGTFALKALFTKDALDEATEALKKDQEAAEASNRAKLIYQHSLEGLIETINEQHKALTESTEAARGEQRMAAIRAAALVIETTRRRDQTLSIIEETEAQIELNRARSNVAGNDPRITGSLNSENDAAAKRVKALRDGLPKADAAILTAQKDAEQLLGLAVQERVEQLSTPLGKLKDRYDRLEESTIAASTAAEKENGVLARKLYLLNQQEQAEARVLQAQERRTRSTNDGVARFKSARQAAGLAGRELQRLGLDVGEHPDFGGVGGGHRGAGHREGRAIDVDIAGATDKSPTPPDIRAKYDGLARSYAKRGYIVLWAGFRYDPSGAVTPITSGDKHFGHIHLEAPRTIVGQPTQGAAGSDTISDFNKAQNIAEQKADYVKGIENRAAGVGLPQDRATALKTQIEGALAEYERKFNEAPSTGERDKIVGALTDADAREQAERFRRAYQYPLEDMQVALGQTGQEREIYNRILAETAAKGAPLDAIEKGMIENSVRMTESYRRQQSILESIKQPVEDYKLQLEALVALLNSGAISQDQFNYRVSQLPMAAQSRDQGVRLGTTSETDAAEQEIMLALQRERDLALQFYEAGVISHAEYERRKTEITRREANARVDAERAVNITRLQLAQQISGDLLSIAEMAVGKQHAIYKALFIASKAFAIAEAVIKIQQGIANALALPFPANLPAIAQVVAAGASIVSSIQQVALNLADGGMVRGPGGPRDDKVPANLSAGEFVVNANAVSQPGNRALLEAINNGSTTAKLRKAGTAGGTLGATPTGANSYAFSFGDVVVQAGNATAEDGQAIGREVKASLRDLVRETMAEEMRPGGSLTRTRQSVMS